MVFINKKLKIVLKWVKVYLLEYNLLLNICKIKFVLLLCGK